jgi:hypothetical protein
MNRINVSAGKFNEHELGAVDHIAAVIGYNQTTEENVQ